MIVIPMMGKSSRFSNVGYKIPKYMLPIGSETVFDHSVKSFEKHFTDQHFVFIVRRDHCACEFVAQKAAKLGIKDFRIKELSVETKGQAESVRIASNDYNEYQSLIIFNIDTIRIDFEIPSKDNFGDGFLEVFEGEGEGWSFVEPVSGTSKVMRTAEKVRISNFCSNGLYAFRTISDFRAAYDDTFFGNDYAKNEFYVAPMYNILIKQGKDIRYHLVPQTKIHHCGLPEDYERYLRECTCKK
jgi:NDP-sugar pyrophosphorylase family protein